MKFSKYIILTHIFEEYGKHRFYEGVYMASRMQKEQLNEKVKAGDAWQKAFAIIKEIEALCTFS